MCIFNYQTSSKCGQMHNLPLIIISLFLLLSCTAEKQPGVGDRKASESGVSGVSKSGTSAGGYALEIIPKNAASNSSLNLIPTGFAISDARVEWIVNNSPFRGGSASQLSSTELRKGDTVQARAFINGYEVLSDQITIMNSPPKIVKLDLVQDPVADAASLRVEASGLDVDGDSVTFLYEWTKNGDSAGDGDRIEGALKRGDAVTVKVIPFDGTDYGVSTIVRRELSNMRPVIAPNKEFTFDGKMYTYQVRASDPDGDTLTYSMASPVNGMTIDPASGLLQWNVPSEFKGNEDVSITVSDGHGGTATYNITITIQ